MKLVIKINEIIGLKGRDKAKYLEATELLEDILNSSDFKWRVLNFVYLRNDTPFYGFHHCDMSRQEVYDMIMSGKDKFEDIPDGELDIMVKGYYSRGGVVGYTYPSSPWTNINKKFLRRWDIPYICSNIMHEYLHNCGLKHSFKRDKYRQYSAPYAIGDIVEKLALAKKNQLPR